MRTNRRIVVLGNGISRKGLPLQRIQAELPVYACNFAYREQHEDGSPFHPDKLFAYAPVVLRNIRKDGYASKFPVYSVGKLNTQQRACPEATFERRVGLSTGGQAVFHACHQEGVKQVFLCGFDFHPKGFPHHMHGNTGGYSDGACTRWAHQLRGFCMTFTGIKFFRVDNEPMDVFKDLPNLIHISRQQFLNRTIYGGE